MDKLQMQSKNLVDENIDFIAKRFPNCVTEAIDENGKLTRLVDFDLLKQELSKDIVEGNDERYTLNWAGKKQAILTANSPINATLRPCREESVDFDSTKNLYIEGDNLDVLKLLRETYLNKVDVIYIDPPYNTGHDFVYEDDFAISTDEYLQSSKSYDEQGNKLFLNNDTNGRFHSDWLSMMYSRLKLAKDLLNEQGVIFISIDDNEYENLRKICNEIFGENNFVSNIIWQKKYSPQNDATYFSTMHDYILCVAKKKKHNKSDFGWDRLLLPRDEKMNSRYSNPDNDPRGDWKPGDFTAEGPTPNCIYEIISPTGKVFLPPQGKRWVFNKENYETLRADNRIWFGKDGNNVPALKRFSSEVQQGMVPNSIWFYEDVGHTQEGKQEANKLFNAPVFDYPKPVRLIKRILQVSSKPNTLVLDFFSGSATTAHAVMKLNAEDGGNRKFIMVQLPEICDKESEAYKAGYKNICEIGKERIRRAGKQIKEAWRSTKNIVNTITNYSTQQSFIDESNKIQNDIQEKVSKLDIGFRCLKLDSSCMKDIYYSPNKMTQDLLTQFEDNIKEDRTPEDLLFQVMLDMGVLLSSEIKTLEINGKKVFNVNDGDLVCCFDKNINDDVVTAIAKMQPLYAVFRDASMSTDSVAVNFDQIFETYSPTTTRKII